MEWNDGMNEVRDLWMIAIEVRENDLSLVGLKDERSMINEAKHTFHDLRASTACKHSRSLSTEAFPRCNHTPLTVEYTIS